MSTLNASFSIGSIGDVTTLLGITHALTKRLSRVDLIYEEHKALQRELQLLQILLVQASSSARVLDMRASEDLERNLMSCKTLVNSILVRVMEIERSLSSKGSKSWAALFRNAGTRMFAEEEVRIYAEQLHEARMKLSVALWLCSSSRRDSCTTATRDSGKSQVAMRNPRTLGYPWEGGIERGREPVHITSATGEEVLVPFEFCSSYHLLTDIMKISIGHEPWSEMALAASFMYRSRYTEEYDKVVSVFNDQIYPYCPEWSIITPGMHLSLRIPVSIWLCRESMDPENDGPFCFELGGRWWVEFARDNTSLDKILKGDYGEYVRRNLRSFEMHMAKQGIRCHHCMVFCFTTCYFDSTYNTKRVGSIHKTLPSGDVIAYDFWPYI